MNKVLPCWRGARGIFTFMLFSLLSFTGMAQVSLSCPSDITVTAATGAGSANVSWQEPAASTTCVLPPTPDCSLVSEDIPGFMYMGEFNGSKYYCSMGNDFTWHEARDLAAAAGGYLAVISSAEENEFVRSVIGNFDAWIGYTDEDSEGDFYWVNGEDSGFENWKCWDNGNCEPSGGDENYVRILKSDGKWTDRDEYYTSEFVMEIPCSLCDAPDIDGFVYMGQFNGSKYYCSDGSNFTWDQAVSLSEAAGGYLVTINNASENEFVRNFIGASKVWIGYTDEGSEGDFHWVNGESSNYTNWKSWAPDGGTSQNYTIMYKSDGKWNDKGPGGHFEFVMEVPCDNAGQPGTVTLTQTAGLPSGSDFAVGTHTISYEATDDCGYSADCSFTVTVNPGQPAQPASVGDYVWEDTNGNGIQDAGEPGIEGVFVMITDCNGNWVNNMLTDANGHYQFDNLTPGTYKIKFGLKPGYVSYSPTDAGSDDALDSDVLPGWTGYTDCFTLASGEDRTDIDAGMIPEAGNGCDDPIVATIDNVLCADNGTPDDPNDDTYTFDLTVTSGADWGWTGGGVTTDMNSAHTTQTFGPYDVSYAQVNFFIVDNDNSNCTFEVIVDSPGPCSGGGNNPASVGDFVWQDDNGNGIQDAGEPGIEGVFVMLTDCDGNWKGQTTTDANGYYAFDNLPPGSYKIKFGLKPGYVSYSPTDAGSDDAMDSDVLPGWTGYTDCFTLAAGENRTDIDAGFVPDNPGGGCDNFTSGGQIAGEQTICAGMDAAPLTNVELPSGGSGAIEYMWLARPGTDCPNSMADAIPGANGPEYDPGVLTETTTFRRCARRVGCTEWVGESNCITVTVDQDPSCGTTCDNFTSGGEIAGTQTICAGEDAAPLTNVELPSGGSGAIEYMWLARPGTDCPNSMADAIPGANGPEYDPGVLTETTTFRRCARRVGCTEWVGESNCITITVDQNPNCGGGSDPASVGDYVWEDTNGNGIQDAGEPGIEGVFVMITDCNGNWVNNMLTDANGHYQFDNLTPGTYKIKFGLKPGYVSYSPTDAGSDDAVDSDVLPGWTGFTDCFTLASGENKSDVDAGMVPESGNGGCDVPIVANIDNVLCNDNGTPNDPSDDNFTFDLTVTTGADWGWTGGGATTDMNNAHSPYTFGPYAIADGQVSFSITDNDNSNCTFDVVVNPPATCSGGTGNDPASVGDFVWEDTNGNGIQDPGEPGIANVFIMLTDCDGNWKGQTTSDANGHYLFDNLTPGNYKIKFVAPANHTVAPTHAGSDGTVDNDVNQGWTGFTDCFTLASGENRTDIDAGFVPDGAVGGVLTLTCPDNVTVVAPAGQNTAVVSWTEPTVSTTCSAGGATVNQTSGPMNNMPMAIGTQTVSYAASDACNNFQTCSFTVTVEAGQPLTPGTVGDFVWQDLNENGIQDPGEPGIENVFVMLTDCSGNWKGQTYTDANGHYQFTDVAPGEYKVKFVGPVNSVPAPTNAGSDDNVDSDLNQGWSGFTDCFNVGAGEDVTNIDAGFIISQPTGTLTFNCNADMNISASSPDGAVVTWDAPTATSTCSVGSVTITQTSGPASGDMLAVGTYTVTYEATDGCGNTETCSFTITVTYDGPAVCTTRTITDLLQCNGTVHSTFWAEDLIFGMSNVSKNYHLVSDGTFTEYEDGTAHFTATVVNNTNANIKFALDFTLTGKTAYNDNPHAPYCFSSDMNDWYYYTAMTGTITGLDALEGAVIHGEHSMYMPQLGTGANLHEDVFGFTSWVALTVISQPNDPSITLDDWGTAHADLNFNLSGDASTCAPDVQQCAVRDVWNAYQCNLDLDYAFYALNVVDEFWDDPEMTHYEAVGSPQFIEYTDGTAHLSMKVRNHYDHSVKFQLELDFSGRTFDMPSDASDAEYCYTPDKSDWYYYTDVTGTITGLDDMDGALINVWNVMHPFQIGTGAALFGDWDDFGGTTWLGYEVIDQPYANYWLNEDGNMDLNIHMSGDATACGGSSDASAARIMALNLDSDRFTANLTWQNNTGDVNDYFVVERSVDGEHFTPIAQVASQKTASRVTVNYTYRDLQPMEGVNYYRVVAITKLGKQYVSNREQAVFGSREAVTVFPNPAGEYFMIDLLPFKGQAATVRITDQLGQVIRSIELDEVGAAPLRISLDKFVNGYYHVQVEASNGDFVTKKLVVSRLY